MPKERSIDLSGGGLYHTQPISNEKEGKIKIRYKIRDVDEVVV
jgi:hypothetical protein